MLFIFTIKYSSQTAYMLFHIGLHLLLWRERGDKARYSFNIIL